MPAREPKARAAGIDHPAPGGVGLLILDMINDLAFEGAEKLRRQATAAAKTVLRLRGQADALKIPVVYVNDNFGQWHSERSRIVEHCSLPDAPGRKIVARLAPRPDDYFVIKPQFSGFYSTNLPVLLPKLRVNRLVVTGLATDICVLFTAADAHMRDYALWVPEDAVAGTSPARARWALEIMRKSMGAEVRPTRALKLQDWMREAAPRPESAQ